MSPQSVMYFKFQLHEFALRDSVGVEDLEHWQGLMGAWEEDKEHWSAGRGMEKKRRRAQEADGKAGETSALLCIRVTALTLQAQNLFSLSTVTFTRPDQVKKRVSGVRGSHVLKGQGSFYSSHVILQWVSFLSFSHHP